VAKRGRDLFDASPAATVGQKRRRSSSGGASAAAAAGGPKSARKTLCACGCPAPGTRRSPPCDEASAADPTSRFRTFWRPLRILAAQRDAIAQKKADGNECRIADAHFEEGGDLPVFYWHAATEEYRRAGAHASTPVPPPPPSTTAQLLRAALDAVPPLGARSLRARVEEALRAADADADEGAQAVARELISRGRAERAEAALGARGDRPLWASVPVPGADAAWSPQFRFEHVEHDDDACTTYFSTTGDVVRAIYNLLNHHGYETSVPLAATSLRAALAAYRAAHGKDAVPGVEVSFTQSKLHLRRRRRGGRPTSLNGINRVALTMRKLRHNETFDKLEKDYNICTSTLERYFSHTIIALDNLFIRIFPPFPYDVAAALTPGSLVEKMGTRVPVYVMDACERARQAASDRIAHGAAFSHYKNRTTNKVQFVAHVGGFPVFVSDAYLGKASDTDMTIALYPHLANIIPHGSTILSDKGYLLATPEFVRLASSSGHSWAAPATKETGEGFTPSETAEQHRIGSPRVVIENIIGLTSLSFKYVADGRHPLATSDLDSAAFRVCTTLTLLHAPRTGGAAVSLASASAAAAPGDV
jgi:hypothetical protein